MRVPVSWLYEFVALPDDVDAIAERLAMLGFPVAEIERRPHITGVVVGRIVQLDKHPNADRLQVAKVDTGGAATLTIATAATNVAAGQTIAVATIGARLPALTIAPRTMRGVASEGMMISAEELALPADWFEDGILQLDASMEPGSDAIAAFGLDTAVLDVEVTSNRPDAMSVIGLARELAASYGIPLRLPSFANPGQRTEAPGEAPRVTIESADCHRFVAQRFDAIRVTDAPAWMRVRLALCGQRPINSLVDVSNYVMLETGQPLHFYDAAAIDALHLVVRDARADEAFVTLDGVERRLDAQALVIADDRRALCIAGIMGGADAEVTVKTTAIVLEAANFSGGRVRKTSAALGLRTEASMRHEKTLALSLTDVGAARAATLLNDLGATAYGPHAFGLDVVAQPSIELRIAEVARLLGHALPAERISGHLSALGCTVEALAGDRFAVTPPPWRRDLGIPADLIEEVARIDGYDRIAGSLPSVPAHEISSARFDVENLLAGELAGMGYREILAPSLVGASFAQRNARAGLAGEPPVEVRNPLSEEQRFLRESLVPGALDYLARDGAPARVFEIGDVFAWDGNAVERSCLLFGFSADRIHEPAWRDSNFLRLKGDCERLIRAVTGREAGVERDVRVMLHPGKTAALSIDGARIGELGAVDPRLSKAYACERDVYVAVIDLAALPEYQIPQYRAPSKYPSTYRDLALIVDVSLEATALAGTIEATLGALCTGATVFDEFRGAQIGDGRKSLAVRVTLARSDATITDEEADAAIARLLDALRERVGATLRT